jgi:hypothetical protein
VTREQQESAIQLASFLLTLNIFDWLRYETEIQDLARRTLGVDSPEKQE